MPRVNDGQHDEVNAIAPLPKAQIRVAGRHDIGGTEPAARAHAAIEQFSISGLSVKYGKVEQIFGSLAGVERDADFEFFGEYPGKGPRMLDEQIFVTRPNHISHAEE